MFGLKDAHIEQIKQKLALFPEIIEATIFGSRAIGNFKKGSDIDLALKGEKVTRKIVDRVRIELEEKTQLPYFFDIVAYDTLKNVELLKHINTFGKKLYTLSREVDEA